MSTRLMKRTGLLAVVTLWMCGCSSPPPVPVMSKAQAMAYADVGRLPGPSKGEVRLELPANNTGQGKHDFYNLFAQYHKGKSVIYGLSLATSARQTGPDTDVLVNGLGPLDVRMQEELAVLRFHKVNYLEVHFSREFVEQSAVSGRFFTLRDEERTYEFQVPDWMFAALLQALDRRLPELRKQSFNVQEVMNRSTIREHYVNGNPHLPPAFQEAILDGEIAQGMAGADVKAAWGDPEIVLRGRDEQGAFEVWRYPGIKLVMDQGTVSGWQME